MRGPKASVWRERKRRSPKQSIRLTNPEVTRQESVKGKRQRKYQQKRNQRKPVFYTDGYNFFLTLWNLNYAYGKAQNKAQNKAQKSQMTDREHILLLLKENPTLTQVELSEMMDKSRRTVQMLMKELLDEGTIERIGSKKKGSWLVK